MKDEKEKKIRGQEAEQKKLRADVDELCADFNKEMDYLFQQRLLVLPPAQLFFLIQAKSKFMIKKLLLYIFEYMCIFVMIVIKTWDIYSSEYEMSCSMAFRFAFRRCNSTYTLWGIHSRFPGHFLGWHLLYWE